MITASIKATIASVVAGLLLLLLIPTGCQNIALKLQIKELQQDKTTLLAEAVIKRLEVQGLVDAIADQNDKITAFENTAAKMAQARLKAQQEAEQRIAQLNNRIAWLETDKGASCTATGIGQTILNEVLPR